MKIFVPYTELQIATEIALIGYEYATVGMIASDDYFKYFKQRWQEGESFINIEHDCVPWPGAIEAIMECPKLWCAYDYSLPCHRNRDIHDPTTFVPLGLTKISASMIEKLKDCWNEVVNWDVIDKHLTMEASNQGIRVHQHFPSIVNANPVLLN